MSGTRTIVEHLEGLGVKKVEAIFAGSGDEGGVVEVIPYTSEGKETVLPRELDGELADLAGMWAQNLFPGYENNEGANGIVRMDSRDGRWRVVVECSHMDQIDQEPRMRDEEVASSLREAVDNGEPPLRDGLSELHDAGIRTVCVFFSGAGDEGDVAEVEAFFAPESEGDPPLSAASNGRPELEERAGEVLGEIVMDVVNEEAFPGFEINEGGGGRIEIDLSGDGIAGVFQSFWAVDEADPETREVDSTEVSERLAGVVTVGSEPGPSV